jgi:hypothetical protein
MDGLTHDDVEHVPQTEQEAEAGKEEEEFKGGQTDYPEYPAACPICGLTLHTLYITHCVICNVKVPLGDTRKGMFKYEFQNRHRCSCGNKELKIAEESSYYIWDMECFTDPVIVREGSPHQEAMVVREHKPIFVAASSMAPLRPYFLHGEDCLDEFLKLVLQDKKFKKKTFLTHNAGGYDYQFVMPWLSGTDKNPTRYRRPGAYDQVRFIDSWNFITIPLGKFGKCFGLSQSKTDFPQ